MRAASRPTILLCILASGLLGCGDDDTSADAGPSDAAPDAGPSCSEWTFAPGAGDLTNFPNLDMLVEDPATATGFRFGITRDAFPELGDYDAYETLFTEQASELDGFGINAAAFVTFTRGFDPALLPAIDRASAGFVTLSTETSIVEASLATVDLNRTLLLTPQRPLVEGAWAAAYVTRSVTEAAGGCLEPSAHLQSALADPTPETTRAIDALVAQEIIASADDLVALLVYPTQTVTARSQEIAAYVRGLPDTDFEVSWRCTLDAGSGTRHCRGPMNAHDFRDADGVVRGAEPTADWQLEVHAYLPDDDGAGAPYPTVLFGHGLTASATDHGAAFAADAASRGVATVAISAVLHPGHPTEPDPPVGGLDATLLFLAADLDARSFDALRARDHFRQSTYDKLHVVRLLALGPDFDDDGTLDVDTTKLGYIGVSLGGIMGSELLALTDAFPIAVFGMPGGRYTQLIIDPMGGFSLIRRGLIPPHWSAAREARTFPMIQTLLEQGDAASYAGHVLEDRFVGEAPNLLAHIVVDDGIVTNEANLAFARAMGLGLVPPQIDDAEGLTLLPAPPLSGNLDGGLTAALQQFDRIEDGSGGVTAATHANFSFSDVAYEAWFHFLRTHWEDGAAEVIDPYSTLDLPPLDG